MRTLKVFYRSFRSLSFHKMIRLLRFSLGSPIFFLLTLRASSKAYGIAARLYPESAGTNGVGNAFRHALWSSLIAAYGCKVHSAKKSVVWAEKFTSFYEELFPNEPIETLMDRHNNAVGLRLFQEMLPGVHRQFFETSFLVEAIKKEVPVARAVETASEISGQHLVYLKTSGGD